MCLIAVIFLIGSLFGAGVARGDVPSAAVGLTRAWIEQNAGADSLAVFDGAGAGVDAAVAHWEVRNPLVHKYYFGHYSGARLYTASQAFFDGLERVPAGFKLETPPFNDEVLNVAVDFTGTLVTRLPEDAVAHSAHGYALLERGDYEASEAIFLEALKRDRKMPEARNGRGLAMMMMKQGAKGISLIQEAFTIDNAYEDAVYTLGIANVLIRTRDIGRWFGEVVKRDPNHYDAWYKLGAFHQAAIELEKDPDLVRASDAYERQIEVNPSHAKAWFQLGSVLLESGRAEDAIPMWDRLMKENPRFRQSHLPLLLKAYQMAGRPDKAEAAAEEYIASLDRETRDLFKDITLIGTPKECAAYEAMDRFDRMSFNRRFWQERDPTPATRANERKVEHYRRVIYAREHFSEGKEPWDRRGEVYIRYGEPAHRSSSENVRFEFRGDVVRVKERLQNSLPLSAQREIVNTLRRLRTAVVGPRQRDEDETGSSVYEASDFESIEYEGANPTRGFDPSGGLVRDRQDVTVRGHPPVSRRQQPSVGILDLSERGGRYRSRLSGPERGGTDGLSDPAAGPWPWERHCVAAAESGKCRRLGHEAAE